MKPKEKALELVNKFRVFADGIDSKTDKFSPNIEKENGKKCALIAVEEILNHHSIEQGLYRIDTYYWQQVKIEINKL